MSASTMNYPKLQEYRGYHLTQSGFLIRKPYDSLAKGFMWFWTEIASTFLCRLGQGALIDALSF